MEVGIKGSSILRPFLIALAAACLAASPTPIAASQALLPPKAPGRIYVTSHDPSGRTFCTLATPEWREQLHQRAAQLAQLAASKAPLSVDRLEPEEAFELTLDGFTPEAEAAFRKAVQIWAQVLDVQVPIKVMGIFESQGPNTLGSGGPSSFTRGFQGAPSSDIWYPFALADQLAGGDLFPDDPSDINTAFNSSFQDFYFGLDGNPPNGQFDFVSVVIHELGHGLGLSDSACVNPESENCEATVVGEGAFGLSAQNLPTIFDSLIELGDGSALTSLANPSAQLGTALVSSNLFFSGPAALEANQGGRPRLYAPPEFDPGASIAHLDELSFPGSGLDGLMTPFIAPQESYDAIGPVTLAVFEDMGWLTVAERLLHFAQFGNGAGFSSAVVVFNPSETLAASGSVEFFDPAGNPIDAAQLVGGTGVFELAPGGSRTFETNGSGNLVVGTAVVRSNRPVAGVLRFRIDVGGLGIAGVGAGLVDDAVITPVRREGSVNTGIAIRNIGTDPVTLKLQRLNESGGPVGAEVTTDPVPGNGQLVGFIDELFGDVPASFRGAMTIRVDGQGKIAVIALELGGPGEFATLPVAALR